jgi:hypothetical protein
MDRGKQERIHLGINERRRPAMFNDGDRIGEQVDGVSGQHLESKEVPNIRHRKQVTRETRSPG